MRKLVTIREISGFVEIPGADNIQLAVVDGWQVIVKKEEFQLHDKCVYFEIDSFLPLDDRYSFLKASKFNGIDGYRIKTMKMRGVISQGLALPLRLFQEISSSIVLQTDVTELLKVHKYDNAVQEAKGGPKAGNAEGKFPSFVPKADQERIQNLTSYFSTMREEEFEETLKLDGSSLTCFTMPKPRPWYIKLINFLGIETKPVLQFRVCSRNLEIKKPTKPDEAKTYDNDGKQTSLKQSDYWTVCEKYDLMSKIPSGFAVQGEMIGPKIQANHEKVQDLEFYCFDVFDIANQRYLLPHERRAFCKTFDIPHVPVVNKSVKILQMDLASLLKHVEGPSMNPDTISEGRVYKHVSKHNVSFKVISNLYLLKSEK